MCCRPSSSAERISFCASGISLSSQRMTLGFTRGGNWVGTMMPVTEFRLFCCKILNVTSNISSVTSCSKELYVREKDCCGCFVLSLPHCLC